MTKKIIKSKMQKQKIQTKIKQSKAPKRKKQPYHMVEKHGPEEFLLLAKKLETLHLLDENQTQTQQPKAKQPAKKSISKKKSTKKSLQKDKPKSKNKNVLPQYVKFLQGVCKVHQISFQTKDLNSKLSLNKKLSQEWFQKINLIWKSDKDGTSHKSQQASKNKTVKQGKVIKKTQKITYVHQITDEMIKRLKPKHWLNDEVINSYIQLMELDILKKNVEQINSQKKEQISVHLIQSYFAALKTTPQKIQRQIKKRGLTTNSFIIIPIHQDYHWFFIVIAERKFFICDSILPKSLKSKDGMNFTKKVYCMKDSIRKCLQLYKGLYQIEETSLTDIEILDMFPQQNNQNDCGMMMLCGMKNILTNFVASSKVNQMKSFTDHVKAKDFWNFCIDDITFYRYLYAWQIIEERIFDY